MDWLAEKAPLWISRKTQDLFGVFTLTCIQRYSVQHHATLTLALTDITVLVLSSLAIIINYCARTQPRLNCRETRIVVQGASVSNPSHSWLDLRQHTHIRASFAEIILFMAANFFVFLHFGYIEGHTELLISSLLMCRSSTTHHSVAPSDLN